MKHCLNTEPNNNNLRINEHVEMGNCRNGDEEFDISDSEIKEYKEAVHKLLKFRNYNVRASNGQFRCPFCVGVEKQEYHRLLDHAVRVAEGSTRSEKQRANHSAMAKYLVIDIASEADRLNTVFEEARQFRCIANAQSKRALEQQEMLKFDFKNKMRWINSLKEDLDKREVALTEEKRKMDELMREKNDLDLFDQHHLAEECLNNDELLGAGKELMKGLENMPSNCRVKFGVMRMLEIDEKAFMNFCKKSYLNETEHKAFELCCFLLKKLRDDNGNPQRWLKEKDKILRGLKDKWGDKFHNAVALVLEHNPNGNGMELWNFEEDRKASHCEVIRYIFTQWKTLLCERDENDEVVQSLQTLPRARTMADTEEDENDEESWEKERCSVPKADIRNAKKDKMAKKDLIKPKRPASAFFGFMEEFQNTFKKQNPNVKGVAAVGKAGGEKWKSLSQAEKAPYMAKSAKLQQEHEKLMNGYNTEQESSGISSSDEDDTCSTEVDGTCIGSYSQIDLERLMAEERERAEKAYEEKYRKWQEEQDRREQLLCQEQDRREQLLRQEFNASIQSQLQSQMQAFFQGLQGNVPSGIPPLTVSYPPDSPYPTYPTYPSLSCYPPPVPPSGYPPAPTSRPS